MVEIIYRMKSAVDQRFLREITEDDRLKTLMEMGVYGLLNGGGSVGEGQMEAGAPLCGVVHLNGAPHFGDDAVGESEPEPCA